MLQSTPGGLCVFFFIKLYCSNRHDNNNTNLGKNKRNAYSIAPNINDNNNKHLLEIDIQIKSNDYKTKQVS